jgi:hypothetical protein
MGYACATPITQRVGSVTVSETCLVARQVRR